MIQEFVDVTAIPGHIKKIYSKAQAIIIHKYNKALPQILQTWIACISCFEKFIAVEIKMDIIILGLLDLYLTFLFQRFCMTPKERIREKQFEKAHSKNIFKAIDYSSC